MNFCCTFGMNLFCVSLFIFRKFVRRLESESDSNSEDSSGSTVAINRNEHLPDAPVLDQDITPPLKRSNAVTSWSQLAPPANEALGTPTSSISKEGNSANASSNIFMKVRYL